MRRSGRSMDRKDRDRGAEMRLTERTRKLIPETRNRWQIQNLLGKSSKQVASYKDRTVTEKWLQFRCYF